MSAAAEVWAGLNDRQRTYLRALYDVDQALEDEHRQRGARGTFDPAPARVWRRISFNGAYSPVVSRLRAAGVYDTGAGATLAALRERGLISSETTPGVLTDMVDVWMTRAGRAAVRAGTGVPAARTARPRWALSEWLWRQMAAVARAGEDGLLAEQLASTTHLYLDAGHGDRRGNRAYLRTEQRMVPVTYRHRMYGNDQTWTTSQPEYRYHLTDAGRAHYAEHLGAYRELYPDIDAPDLDVQAAGADLGPAR
ncbi:hypothetical protein [Candidatus Frankia alpina]|uniref:Uncharacterized protein n=1 Tax=Candidatus Frankia alpina TaxID=2699483 RepID=A0A4S5E182_9ACTN|nr:hypothetical protein [Candidatus Frankia alpina]THJ65101.1 hypothetical protein E7Y31_17230 [Candidatus Frankia alpina]